MKRREFPQTTASVAVATAVVPSFSFAEKRKIGLQLYSLRDVINANVRGTLKKVADFGYKQLETYGYVEGKLFGMKSREFSDTVKELGMRITSGHYSQSQMNDWERAIADAKETGQDYMVISSLDIEARKRTLDDYKKGCEMMNKSAEMCKRSGLRLGYHNHDGEFNLIDGQIPYNLMLKELDPKLVGMELDIYWIVFAGHDPLQYIARYPGRFEQWHVKDMNKTDRKLNADVGTGSIDFKPLFAKAAQSGLKHFYVEQETYPRSPIESVGACINYLKTIV